MNIVLHHNPVICEDDMTVRTIARQLQFGVFDPIKFLKESVEVMMSPTPMRAHFSKPGGVLSIR